MKYFDELVVAIHGCSDDLVIPIVKYGNGIYISAQSKYLAEYLRCVIVKSGAVECF